MKNYKRAMKLIELIKEKYDDSDYAELERLAIQTVEHEEEQNGNNTEH